MKKFLLLLTALPGLLCALDYEFLTPQVLVVKGENANPAGLISTQYGKWGLWKKENALLRDSKGGIQRKADVTFYQYIMYLRASNR